MGLGRFSFYLIREDLSRCQLAVKYASLARCLLDEKKPQLLQLQLTDKEAREGSLPPKMNIYSLDRSALVDQLTCYWQIDYMYRYTTFV